MKMNKRNILPIISSGIILPLFNAMAFFAPFIRSTSFWIGYAFTMAAIVLTVVASFYAFREETMRSELYGLSLPIILWTYLIVQVVLSFIFMAAPMIPLWISLLVSLALLAVFLVGLPVLNPGKEYGENSKCKGEEEIDYIIAFNYMVRLMNWPGCSID